MVGSEYAGERIERIKKIKRIERIKRSKRIYGDLWLQERDRRCRGHRRDRGTDIHDQFFRLLSSIYCLYFTNSTLNVTGTFGISCCF